MTSIIKVNLANQVQSATLVSGVTGFVSYVKNGRMLTVHGVITITSAKSAGSVLASGLPVPLNSWSVGNIIPFVGDSYLRISDDGTLINASAISAGTNNIRFAYSYISNS